MIDAISFQIECVSPTLNLGADKQPEDEIFRAASLRGCWRFWARAAIAGILEKPDPNTLRLLENFLFGSVEPAFQTFRMRVSPCNSLPYSKGKQTGFSTGSRAKVLLSFNQGLAAYKESLKSKPEKASKVPIWDESAKNALLAVIWLWGNLGGIGSHSRRGFGSVALLPHNEQHNHFHEAGLPLRSVNFLNQGELDKHIKDGIQRSFQLIKEWKEELSSKHPLPNLCWNKANEKMDMFILDSFSCVFVGKHPVILNDLKKEMRDEPDKIVRVHQCDAAYFPVLAWSKNIEKIISNRPWIDKLGFDKSLSGNSIYD